MQMRQIIFGGNGGNWKKKQWERLNVNWRIEENPEFEIHVGSLKVTLMNIVAQSDAAGEYTDFIAAEG